MAVKREGFKAEGSNGPGNGKGSGKGFTDGTEFADHIMGTDDADIVNAGAGDDLVIGYGGDDVLAGGEGQDNLNGGAGNDVLVGGVWTDAGVIGTLEAGEVTDDAARDTYGGESSFAENGTDTVMGYGDGDVIDLSSALGGAFDAALELALGDAQAAWDALVAEGYVSFADGTLSVDTDGTVGEADTSNAWFLVQDVDGNDASSVVIVIGSNEFTMPPVI